MISPRWIAAAFALSLAAASPAQSLAAFEKKVTEFTLPNGFHFLVVERHDAPVVSFHSYVNAGSVDDPGGETGIAHMFEHMAFKGTSVIGTLDYAHEKSAMENIERVYDAYDAERNKGFKVDAARVAELRSQLNDAIETAEKYVDPNAFPRIVEENGGVGVNASTGEDSTSFYYSLPSNRLELWFLLEAERFRDPVFREFYKERDVVREEHRMSVESNPQGKLLESLLATAFAAHPYRVMPGGWASDIENFRLGPARDFYRKYYVPGNITIGIAGDVDPRMARKYAEKYFAGIPAGPPPPPVDTVEPEQHGEKRVVVETAAQPLLAIAYKRPDRLDKDDPVFDVLGDLLSGGRTSLLYRDLVRDKQIALGAFAEADFPGGKYPGLFIFYVVPNRGHSTAEAEKECYETIERLKNGAVDAEALRRVKTKIRASLIRELDSNAGLAAELTSYSAAYGDWRKLFTSIGDIEKVTAQDVQRIARKYLVPETRTVAWLAPPPAAAADAKGAGQ